MTQASTTVPDLTLNTGATIPQLGFGVWEISTDETATAVSTALEAGYRHIDTAAIYGNEEGVGQAVAASGIPREELFVTTKLWNNAHGTEAAQRAFDTSLGKLGLDYVDLYLIHWPVPSADHYVEAWRALEGFHADGRAKAIGVSNFNAEHLQRVLDEGNVVPAANQIEVHPLLVQEELRTFGAGHGIVTESWSPLAQSRLNADPTVAKLAAKYDREPAQILLRWNLQLGNVVLTRSRTPERIVSNLALFDFEFTGEDLDALSSLDLGSRGGPDPATFSIGV